MLIFLIALAVLIGAAAWSALAGYRSLLAHLPRSNADFDCFRADESTRPATSMPASAARAMSELIPTPAAHAA